MPPSDSNAPHCEVCSIEIEWSGRGRRPKKCAEHKTRTASTGTTRRARSTKLDARLKDIEEGLTRVGAKTGASMGKWMPVTGIVVLTRSERFAQAAVKLCKDHPKLLEGLESVSKADPALDIVETFAAIACASAVDMGRLRPDGFILAYLGVKQAYDEIYPDGPEVAQSTNGYRSNMPPVSGFVPVRVR